jgi:hypothetical protein
MKFIDNQSDLEDIFSSVDVSGNRKVRAEFAPRATPVLPPGAEASGGLLAQERVASCPDIV